VNLQTLLVELAGLFALLERPKHIPERGERSGEVELVLGAVRLDFSQLAADLHALR
jgi:hypothetical protein